MSGNQVEKNKLNPNPQFQFPGKPLEIPKEIPNQPSFQKGNGNLENLFLIRNVKNPWVNLSLVKLTNLSKGFGENGNRNPKP